MFTLYDLTNQVTICGNVRLSTFDDNGDEHEITELYEVADLHYKEIGKHMEREIAYMFAGDDGFLHIETKSYDE